MAKNVKVTLDVEISKSSLSKAVREVQQALGSAASSFNKMINFTKSAAGADKMAQALKSAEKYAGKLNKTTESSAKSFPKISTEVRNTAIQIERMNKQLSTAAVRLSAWTAVATALFGIKQAFSSVIRESIAFDRQVIESTKVMQASYTQHIALSKSIREVAASYAIDVVEAAKAYAVFAQQGLDFASVLNLGQEALKLSKVSVLSTAQATETLTAVIKQFNLSTEEATRIVDAFNEIANRHAVTEKDLAEAFMRSGAAAKSVGMTWQELSGAITALQAATRLGGRQVGTGLRTILVRIYRPESEQMLAQYGIAIRNLQGEIRPAMEILSQLSSIWDQLSDAERYSIGVTMAGVRRYSLFAALMNNFSEALLTVSDAADSQGSAAREMEYIWMSSSERIKKAIIEIHNALAEKLLPIIEKVVNAISGLVELPDRLGAVGHAMSSIMKAGILSFPISFAARKFVKPMPLHIAAAASSGVEEFEKYYLQNLPMKQFIRVLQRPQLFEQGFLRKFRRFFPEYGYGSPYQKSAMQAPQFVKTTAPSPGMQYVLGMKEENISKYEQTTLQTLYSTRRQRALKGVQTAAQKALASYDDIINNFKQQITDDIKKISSIYQKEVKDVKAITRMTGGIPSSILKPRMQYINSLKNQIKNLQSVINNLYQYAPKDIELIIKSYREGGEALTKLSKKLEANRKRYVRQIQKISTARGMPISPDEPILQGLSSGMLYKIKETMKARPELSFRQAFEEVTKKMGEFNYAVIGSTKTLTDMSKRRGILSRLIKTEDRFALTMRSAEEAVRTFAQSLLSSGKAKTMEEATAMAAMKIGKTQAWAIRWEAIKGGARRIAAAGMEAFASALFVSSIISDLSDYLLGIGKTLEKAQKGNLEAQVEYVRKRGTTRMFTQSAMLGTGAGVAAAALQIPTPYTIGIAIAGMLVGAFIEYRKKLEEQARVLRSVAEQIGKATKEFSTSMNIIHQHIGHIAGAKDIEAIITTIDNQREQLKRMGILNDTFEQYLEDIQRYALLGDVQQASKIQQQMMIQMQRMSSAKYFESLANVRVGILEFEKRARIKEQYGKDIVRTGLPIIRQANIPTLIAMQKQLQSKLPTYMEAAWTKYDKGAIQSVANSLLEHINNAILIAMKRQSGRVSVEISNAMSVAKPLLSAIASGSVKAIRATGAREMTNQDLKSIIGKGFVLEQYDKATGKVTRLLLSVHSKVGDQARITTIIGNKMHVTNMKMSELVKILKEQAKYVIELGAAPDEVFKRIAKITKIGQIRKEVLNSYNALRESFVSAFSTPSRTFVRPMGATLKGIDFAAGQIDVIEDLFDEYNKVARNLSRVSGFGSRNEVLKSLRNVNNSLVSMIQEAARLKQEVSAYLSKEVSNIDIFADTPQLIGDALSRSFNKAADVVRDMSQNISSVYSSVMADVIADSIQSVMIRSFNIATNYVNRAVSLMKEQASLSMSYMMSDIDLRSKISYISPLQKSSIIEQIYSSQSTQALERFQYQQRAFIKMMNSFVGRNIFSPTMSTEDMTEKIKELFKSGKISKEQEVELQKRVNALAYAALGYENERYKLAEQAANAIASQLSAAKQELQSTVSSMSDLLSMPESKRSQYEELAKLILQYQKGKVSAQEIYTFTRETGLGPEAITRTSRLLFGNKETVSQELIAKIFKSEVGGVLGEALSRRFSEQKQQVDELTDKLKKYMDLKKEFLEEINNRTSKIVDNISKAVDQITKVMDKNATLLEHSRNVSKLHGQVIEKINHTIDAIGEKIRDIQVKVIATGNVSIDTDTKVNDMLMEWFNSFSDEAIALIKRRLGEGSKGPIENNTGSSGGGSIGSVM